MTSRWAATQRHGFEKLTGEQQALPPRSTSATRTTRSREEMWAHNLRAAAQYRARVGNLAIPRSHAEEVDGEAVRLGTWISQQV